MSAFSTEDYLRWLMGWNGDTPTKMILTAPAERQEFFLWRRSKLTSEVMMRQLDMFEQTEKP